MLESLAATVINQLLGEYISNLETKQLSLGIWNGDVVLHKLRLKKDALSKLRLPIDVVEGFLGELTLKIPWSDLKNKPLKILIQDLYILAAPKSSAEYDPIEEEDRAYETKLAKLTAAEEWAARKGQSDAENASFFSQLMTKVIDNVQITIRNIHIRYEDLDTIPGSPFCIGFTLTELSAISTDEDGNEGFNDEKSTSIFKKLQLKNLGTYCSTDSEFFKFKSLEEMLPLFASGIPKTDEGKQNRQYIVGPVSGDGRLVTAKKVDPDTPKTALSLLFDDLAFTIDDRQYSIFIRVLAAFSRYNKSLPYRHLRPPLAITPKMDPKAWLQYAMKSVLMDISQKRRVWSWYYIKERRDRRLSYISLYSKSLSQPLNLSDKSELEELERILSFDDIRLYRFLAKSRGNANQSSASSAAETSTPTSSSWTSWLLGSTSPSAQTSSSNPSQSMTDVDLKQLYDTIEFDPHLAELEAGLPPTAIRFDISAELKSGSLKLRKHNSSQNLVDFAEIIFDHLKGGLKQYTKAYKSTWSVEDFFINDYSVFPCANIVRGKERKINEQGHTPPLFHATYEHLPFDHRAEDALALYMLPMEIIFNVQTIKEVTKFFTPQADEQEGVMTIQSAARGAIQRMTAQTKAGLSYAIAEHKVFDLRVQIDAPLFIIPSDCDNRTLPAVVIDAGRFNLRSILVDVEKKKKLKELEYKDSMNMKELQSFLYDQLEISLTGMQVLVGPWEAILLSNPETVERCWHIVENINLKVDLATSILPQAVEFAKYKLRGQLPRLHVNFSDFKYRTALSIIQRTLSQLFSTSVHTNVLENSDNRLPMPNYNIDLNRAGSDQDFVDALEDASAQIPLTTLASAENFLEQIHMDFQFCVGEVSIAFARQTGESVSNVVIFIMSTLAINLIQRTWDQTGRVSLKSIAILDGHEFVPKEFARLVDSSQAAESGKDVNLVTIGYESVSPQSPRYTGFDYTLAVSLGRIRFNLVLQSILDAYDLIFSTCFISSGDTSSSRPKDTLDESNLPSPIDVTPSRGPQIKGNIQFHFEMLSVCFVENGTSLGVGQAENFDFELNIEGQKMTLNGSLGRIQVINNIFEFKNEPQMILHVQDHQTASFSFKTLEESSFDSHLTLDASSWKITYNRNFISRILAFIEKFMQMQALLDSARRAATQSARRIQQGAGKFQLEIHMRTPIIEVPRTHTWPCDLLVLHLGEIFIDNFKEHQMPNESFLPVSQRFFIQLKNMMAMSLLLKSDDTLSNASKVVENVNITILHDSVLPGGQSLPSTMVRVLCSSIQGSLTDVQYRQIYDVWRLLTTSSEPANPATVDLKDSRKKPETEYIITFPQISIDTFVTDHGQESSTALANFTGHSSTLKFVGFSDFSFDLEIRLSVFSIYDTRSGKSHFREMMIPTAETDDQFILHCTGNLSGASYSLVVDRPKLVFDLEHLLAVRRFWVIDMSADISASRSNAQKIKGKDLQPGKEASFSFRVTFVESEVTLIRDPQRNDSEGVILKMENFVVLVEQTMFISCQGVGMFLCQLDKGETSNIRVLDDADLTFTHDARAMSSSQALTQISISTTMLLIRMSYRDILLCRNILNNISAILNSNDSSETTRKNDGETQQNLQEVSRNLKEKLSIKSDGVRFVLIDDVDDLYLPMFDFAIEKTALDIQDWSTSIQLSTSIAAHLNYFNIKNSNWEPFMEKWSFSISAKKPTSIEPYTYEIFSKTKLDLNVSPVILDTLSRASKALSGDIANVGIRKESRSPYVIRNRTGYQVQIWTETNSKALPSIHKIETNGELNWSFDDWKTMRQKTSLLPSKLFVQLEGPPWEAVKGVSVDQEGSTLYVLRPPLNRVIHKLDCHVTLEKKVKIVTLRSTYVLNNDTNIPLEIRAFNREKKATTFIDKIESKSQFAVPIESAYYDAIYIRPLGFGYNWNTEGLHWRDIDRVDDDSIIATCHSLDKASPSFRLQIETLHSSIKERGLYPALNLRIVAPLTLENLLPFTIRYVIREQQSRQETRGELNPGDIDPLHTVDPSRTVGLKIEVVDQELKQKEFALIVANEDYQDHAIHLTDKANRQLDLKLNYGGARKRAISISSPYVIYNKTGMDMTFNSRSFSVTSKAINDTDKCRPVLFSFTGFDSIQNRAQVKVANSDWSKNLSFEAVGTSTAVNIPTLNRSCVHLGMHIQEGPDKYYLSKVVTFQPRFIFKNTLSQDVHCQASGNSSSFVVKKNEDYPLLMLPPEDQFNGCIQVRTSDLMGEWSTEFSIIQIGSIYVKLKSMTGDKPEQLIRVDVMLEKATIFVAFSKQESERWPIKIVNQTDIDLWCWQQKSSSKYQVLRKETLNYAWDYPSLDHKALVIHANGRERLVDTSQFGSLAPFKYPIPGSNRHQIMDIDIVAEGPVVVVKLVPRAKSHLKQRTGESDSEVAPSSAVSEKSEPNTESTPLTRIHIRFEGIGVSFLSRQVQEIAYATIKSVILVYQDTTVDEAWSVSVGWLQIDNQTYGTTFPLIAYPTVVPKEDAVEEPHPVIMASACRSKDISYGVEYYKWFTILVQELSVEFDEDFLYTISEFLKAESLEDIQPQVTLADWNKNPISFPRAYEDGDRLYFEKMLLHPIQINLSFSRTNNTSNNTGTRSSGIVGLVYDVLTMTIGNIHDAPIKLNALELEHPSLTLDQLMDLVMRFYTQEGVGQVHKILGAADFLGNPVGLFNNVASGVSDMFYEPFQGFEITKPQEFGLGVAKGASSLVKKTVFGVSDTLSKFTGSIGKGLSVMTLDDKFQEKRRMASRNRPKHVVYGVTTGAASFIRSVTSGVTGVVSQPLRGAQESGVEGFFKGLGKGLVGVVTKPIVGVVDLAANVSEGIKNTTTVFDTELDRQRLPRYVGRSKILKPYNKREALGLNFLRTVENGRFFHEFYVCHLEIRIEDLVCIVTENRVMMARMKRMRLDWDIQYHDVQVIRAESSGSVGIVPKQHRQSSGVLLIPVPDANSGHWLRAQIEEAFSNYLATHKPVD